MAVQLHGLAALLEELLPPFSDDPDYAVRSSMRILPARLRAKPGLPHVADVHELLQTIGIYEEGEPAQVLRQMVDRFGGAQSPAVATEADEDWYRLFPSERDETPTLACPLDTAPSSTPANELVPARPPRPTCPYCCQRRGRTAVRLASLHGRSGWSSALLSDVTRICNALQRCRRTRAICLLR